MAVFNEGNNFRENFIGETGIIAYKPHPDGGKLPHVLVGNFGDGNVKLVAQLGDDRPDCRAFTLEGMVVRETEFDFADTDVHCIKSPKPSVYVYSMRERALQTASIENIPTRLYLMADSKANSRALSLALKLSFWLLHRYNNCTG
jgi:hypothetical protein